MAGVVILGGGRPGPEIAKAMPNASRLEASVFVFQNRFWVNLHHFLRGESWRHLHQRPLRLPLAALTEAERVNWQGALDVYGDLGNRNLIFDATLIRIDNWLAMTAFTLTAPTLATDGDIAAALARAAPTYRAHQWSADDAANTSWIRTHAAAIQQMAPAARQAIAHVFQISAPTDPILVDVVGEVGPNLAYTTGGPRGFSGHTCVSPAVNSDSDDAVDTLLHEISHTMDGQIRQVVDAEAARQHVEVPADLWHAMTLYTTHELVRRTAGRRRDDPAYAPNAAFVKMFDSPTWRAILVDLDGFWRPYLEGNERFETSLSAVVQHAPRP